MDSSCFQFYKHMGGFFMHSISLPEKLTRKLQHLVGKLLELRGPTGNSWYVGLIKSGETLVLQPGWNDFASANGISQNDNVVFKLVGGSKFEVFVFDPSGCEKNGMVEKEEEEEGEGDGDGEVVGEELCDDACVDGEERDEKCEVVRSLLDKKKYTDGEEGEIRGEKESDLLNKRKSTDEELGKKGEKESSLCNKKKSIDEKQGEIRGEMGRSRLDKKRCTDEELGKKGEKESSLYNKKKFTDEELGNKGETKSALLDKKKSTDEELGKKGEKKSSLLNKEKFTSEKQGEIRGEMETSLYNKKKCTDEELGKKGDTESSLLNKKKSTDEELGKKGEKESSLYNKKKSTNEEQQNKGETKSSLLNKKNSADEELGKKGEMESSLLSKKKSTDEEKGGSEASNESISLAEMRKMMLYQKLEVRKSNIKTKMQQPNITTKLLPSKKLELNREEKDEEGISNDLVPIGELLRINPRKNKHRSEIERPLKRPRQNPSNNNKINSKGKSIVSCYNNYTPRVPQNAEEHRRARQLARKVKNGNPYFHKVLTKWNLTHLQISAKFCADHLKREPLEVILRSPDDEKTWYATSYFRSAKNYHTLSGPTWEKFAREKSLQIHDLCLFELDKSAKRLTFVVHISTSCNKLDS